ncbi:hypothetical protein MJ904_16825 [Massilia sp. MB5]|uniref:hypothetical protein n=1 Tax=Massilia sp. MB5 TaxID=2919578 RepID=UPI001F109472|nr:hypothetical protein [Massilia sp. MB5]UMR28786.1 hypothetical protein MJ904_16825 [Massilia sp. MB5]
MKNTQKPPRSFAFKLAEKPAKSTQPEAKWKTRDGLATAGCTGMNTERYTGTWNTDNGMYC